MPIWVGCKLALENAAQLTAARRIAQPVSQQMERTATPTVHLPVAYRAYQAFTRRYLVSAHATRMPTWVLLEWPIRLIAMILGRLRGFYFPRSAIGGWWWIWRYRFEMLVGWYEYPTTLWMRRLVRPGMVAVDIGAHIGYFSSLLSRLVGPTGKVLAFEPSPENFPLLLHNISQMGCLNVVPIQAAVSDRPGRPLLYVSPGHSNHSLVPGYTDSEGTVTVDAVSLDQYCASSAIHQVDLIKIDAEGAEPLILAGMKQLLSATPRLAMIVEVNPNALRSAGSSPQLLLALLAAHGYISRLILPDGRLLDPKGQSFDGAPNLLCLRPAEWEDLYHADTAS